MFESFMQIIQIDLISFHFYFRFIVNFIGLFTLSVCLSYDNHFCYFILFFGYFRICSLLSIRKCDPGIGVDRFFHALYTQYRTRILMLLGSACSEVTESLAKVVPYWNILQVRGACNFI